MSRWKEKREEERRAIEQAMEEQQDQLPKSLEEVEAEFAETLNPKTLQDKLAEQRKKEKQQMKDVGDTNYYFTVYFNNRDQLNEFCEIFDLDKEQIHFDGREIAKAFRRVLRTADRENHKNRPTSKEYIELAMDKKDK